jgi:hypothetical protein
MGQQQLLLIVLGVIIVGITIVVGITLFKANAVQSNRDGLISEMTAVAALAQEYYRKPSELSGGSNSFTGFVIPTNLQRTTNGRYSATVRAQSITLVGRGVEIGNNGTSVVRVTMRVGANSMLSVRINN